jgi:hypothetical protein
LQNLVADRDWWSASAGTHYRELAQWLRGIAVKCRLLNPQQELLTLARRYEIRSNHLNRKSRGGRDRYTPPAIRSGRINDAE